MAERDEGIAALEASAAKAKANWDDEYGLCVVCMDERRTRVPSAPAAICARSCEGCADTSSSHGQEEYDLLRSQ